MVAPLSIVIPTLNSVRSLGPTLAALGEGLSVGLIRDLVISDGGSGDGIEEIAEATGARLVSGPAGRGGQLARGAAAAGGEWLLFLHADTLLSPGWATTVAQVLGDPERAWAFRLRFDAAGMAPRMVAGWANLRSALLRLPYGDQGLLISRALHDRVGGFPDIPLMEDVAMARALGGRVSLLPVAAITSAERYRARGWLRQGTGNLLRLARYLAGADPYRLARGYSRQGAAGRDQVPRN